MRRSILVLTFLCTAVVVPAVFVSERSSVAAPQHGFSVKQYEEFHDVLHPLQHEALPANDLRQIRSKSALLVKRGRAIVKIGAPASVSEANKEEFAKSLTFFSAALTKFEKAARKGTNERLKTSYIAVHDSFESLADLIPRR